jgi:hypothetical protein
LRLQPEKHKEVVPVLGPHLKVVFLKVREQLRAVLVGKLEHLKVF